MYKDFLSSSLLFPYPTSFLLGALLSSQNLPTTQARLHDNAPENERKDDAFLMRYMENVPSSPQAPSPSPHPPLLIPLS